MAVEPRRLELFRRRRSRYFATSFYIPGVEDIARWFDPVEGDDEDTKRGKFIGSAVLVLMDAGVLIWDAALLSFVPGGRLRVAVWESRRFGGASRRASRGGLPDSPRETLSEIG